MDQYTRRRRLTTRGLFLLSACLALRSTARAVDVSGPAFQSLGGGSIAYSVANDATVVGRLGENAAVWRPGIGWTSLGFVGYAYGVSSDGSAVAGFTGQSAGTIDANVAFRWTPTGGVQSLGSLPGGQSGSQATGISADGNALTGSIRNASGTRQAFVWSDAAGYTNLTAALGNPLTSIGRSASADASVIVGDLWRHPAQGGDAAFVLRNGALRVLDGSDGGMRIVNAQAVSADGSTVVGSGPGGKASRWPAATGGDLLGSINPDDGNSEARDVTADGSMITGYFYAHETTQTAFLWDRTHGMRDLKQLLQDDYGLNLTGWTLQTAVISDDGRTLAGLGRDPSGAAASFLVTGLPEPSTLLILAAATTFTVRGSRRRPD